MTALTQLVGDIGTGIVLVAFGFYAALGLHVWNSNDHNESQNR